MTSMLRRYVRDYELFPAGYRRAWHDYSRHASVCYPIGIHVIAWLCWRIWRATFFRLPEDKVYQLDAERYDLQMELLKCRRELALKDSLTSHPTGGDGRTNE